MHSDHRQGVRQPLGLCLVSKGTTGHKLLFRYPLEAEHESGKVELASSERVPYSIVPCLPSSSVQQYEQPNATRPHFNDFLGGLAENDMVAQLFAVRTELCGNRFEMKLNELRFVGHPQLISRPAADSDQSANEQISVLRFTLVFVLKASASRSVVGLLQDLSKQMALSLDHEQMRCGYLSRQVHIMSRCLEETNREPEATAGNPYRLMLQRCELARQLKLIFEDLCEHGVVDVHVNNWVHVSLCIPEKVLELKGLPPLSPEKLEMLLKHVRPYHTLALLEDAADLVAVLPMDASPTMSQLLRVLTPLKNLHELAADADLPLTQVYLLARELVLWGKAIMLFPLCEANLYTVSEQAIFGPFEREAFAEHFGGADLVASLFAFSPPISLGEYLHPAQFDTAQQEERLKIVDWLLKRQFLIQLHTFVHLCPPHVNNLELEATLITETSEQYMSPDVALIEQMLDAARPPLSVSLRRTLLKTCSTLHSWQADLSLFLTIVPYLSGQQHCEQVMFECNIRRARLLRLLDVFQQVIVTRVAPDQLSLIMQSLNSTSPSY